MISSSYLTWALGKKSSTISNQHSDLSLNIWSSLPSSSSVSEPEFSTHTLILLSPPSFSLNQNLAHNGLKFEETLTEDKSKRTSMYRKLFKGFSSTPKNKIASFSMSESSRFTTIFYSLSISCFFALIDLSRKKLTSYGLVSLFVILSIRHTYIHKCQYIFCEC